jgi:hypothetical protein
VSPETEFLTCAVLIGIGATIIMDLWAILLKRVFAIPSLDYRIVGRWFLYMPQGKFSHNTILKTPPVRGELSVGWLARYLTGILFAGLLLALTGLEWAQHPTILPALATGIISVAAPFFIMQPGFGFGIAASKTPAPATARFRSLMAHTVFGTGLYLAALLTAFIW